MAENPEKERPTGAARGADLARALVAGEFFLVYQPVLDLSRGRFTGVEALMRWRHDGAVLAPAQFLDELEVSGLIGAVGRWALATACNQGAEWHSRGYRLSVSVNVSARQVASASFLDDVAVALGASRLTPPALILEIGVDDVTEVLAEQLRRVGELGVRVALDNFDPDTDSLDAWARSGVGVLKLARDVVSRLHGARGAQTALHELISQADSLGLAVVATGIEDAEQRRALLGEHVVSGQGFFFSQPREALEIDDYLQGFSIFTGEPL